MSEAFVSVLDILENDPAKTGLKNMRDELMTLDLQLRRRMDQGLAPAEMSKAQTARDMVHAADSILEKLSA